MAIRDFFRNLIRPQVGSNGSKPPVQTPETQAPPPPEATEGSTATETPETPIRPKVAEVAKGQWGAMRESQADPRIPPTPEAFQAGVAGEAKAQHLAEGTWGAGKSQAPSEPPSGESKG